MGSRLKKLQTRFTRHSTLSRYIPLRRSSWNAANDMSNPVPQPAMVMKQRFQVARSWRRRGDVTPPKPCSSMSEPEPNASMARAWPYSCARSESPIATTQVSARDGSPPPEYQP